MIDADMEVQRGYIVAKSNSIVRHSRYNLSEVEQKIVLYLISKIKPDDTQLQPYEFSISEYCKLCGVDYRRNKSTYDYIRQVIKALADKSFWIQQGDSKVLCRWISKAKAEDSTMRFTIQLDDDLAPYLLQLRDNFTAFELECALSMRSKYAIRLYEMVKSYAHMGAWSVSLDELRDCLALNGAYPSFSEFRRNILEKAIPEINTYSDLSVTWATVTKGRKVTDIAFIIRRKPYGQYPNTRHEREKRLGGGRSE